MGSDLGKLPDLSLGIPSVRGNRALSLGAQASVGTVPFTVSPKLMEKIQSCFQKIPLYEETHCQSCPQEATIQWV